MLLALAGVSAATMAQQKPVVVEQVDIIQVQDKYQVITNPFWSNWFFSIGGGASVMYGDNDQQLGDFGKRISPTMNISVGKWFTPGLGLRLQYSGLQAKGFTMDPFADYVKGTQRANGSYKQRFDYMNFHGDVMFNLNALFGGYNEDRVYEIIPYLGAGLTHNYTKPHRQALALNAGIINRFRISNAIDINLELSAMGAEDKFDGTVAGKGYDGVFSATLGLTYHFPKRGFNRPTPQLISALELSAMQQQIAEMAAANQQLESALTAAQNKLEEIEQENKKAENDCSNLFTWASTYQNASFQQRQAILNQFIKEVRVGRDYDIEIILNVPLEEFEEFKSHSLSVRTPSGRKTDLKQAPVRGLGTPNGGIVVFDKTSGEAMNIMPKSSAHVTLRCQDE